eukprot:jgi/Mesvir1/25763/Mv01939-RA.2
MHIYQAGAMTTPVGSMTVAGMPALGRISPYSRSASAGQLATHASAFPQPRPDAPAGELEPAIASWAQVLAGAPGTPHAGAANKENAPEAAVRPYAAPVRTAVRNLSAPVLVFADVTSQQASYAGSDTSPGLINALASCEEHALTPPPPPPPLLPDAPIVKPANIDDPAPAVAPFGSASGSEQGGDREGGEDLRVGYGDQDGGDVSSTGGHCGGHGHYTDAGSQYADARSSGGDGCHGGSFDNSLSMLPSTADVPGSIRSMPPTPPESLPVSNNPLTNPSHSLAVTDHVCSTTNVGMVSAYKGDLVKGGGDDDDADGYDGHDGGSYDDAGHSGSGYEGAGQHMHAALAGAESAGAHGQSMAHEDKAGHSLAGDHGSVEYHSMGAVAAPASAAEGTASAATSAHPSAVGQLPQPVRLYQVGHGVPRRRYRMVWVAKKNLEAVAEGGGALGDGTMAVAVEDAPSTGIRHKLALMGPLEGEAHAHPHHYEGHHYHGSAGPRHHGASGADHGSYGHVGHLGVAAGPAGHKAEDMRGGCASAGDQGGGHQCRSGGGMAGGHQHPAPSGMAHAMGMRPFISMGHHYGQQHQQGPFPGAGMDAAGMHATSGVHNPASSAMRGFLAGGGGGATAMMPGMPPRFAAMGAGLPYAGPMVFFSTSGGGPGNGSCGSMAAGGAPAGTTIPPSMFAGLPGGIPGTQPQVALQPAASQAGMGAATGAPAGMMMPAGYFPHMPPSGGLQGGFPQGSFPQGAFSAGVGFSQCAYTMAPPMASVPMGMMPSGSTGGGMPTGGVTLPGMWQVAVVPGGVSGGTGAAFAGASIPAAMVMSAGGPYMVQASPTEYYYSAYQPVAAPVQMPAASNTIGPMGTGVAPAGTGMMSWPVAAEQGAPAMANVDGCYYFYGNLGGSQVGDMTGMASMGGMPGNWAVRPGM